MPCKKGEKNGFHGNIGFVVLAFEAGIRQRQIGVGEVVDLHLTGGAGGGEGRFAARQRIFVFALRNGAARQPYASGAILMSRKRRSVTQP